MASKVVFLFLVLLISGFQKQVEANLGVCPDTPIQPRFMDCLFDGYWYEYAKTFQWDEIAGSCRRFQYMEPVNGIATVKQRVVIKSSGDEIIHTAKLKVVKPGEATAEDGYDIRVVGTDYYSYAVVSACKNVLILKSDDLWILTRDPRPDQSVIDQANEVIKRNKLSTFSMTKTDQSCD